MLFVVDKPRLQRIIAITRDDHDDRPQQEAAPFLRLEANQDHLRIAGKMVEAEFPATVYEPGVLFLRVTIFQRILNHISLKEMGTRYMAIQVNKDGLIFDNYRLGFNIGDMLFYPDPVGAPLQHPEERLSQSAQEPEELTCPRELYQSLC